MANLQPQSKVKQASADVRPNLTPEALKKLSAVVTTYNLNKGTYDLITKSHDPVEQMMGNGQTAKREVLNSTGGKPRGGCI